MLGSSLCLKLSETNEVFGTGNSAINLPVRYKIFDLLNENYDELINWSNPDLIIHCAALTNGNYCQENYLDAFSINSFSIQKLLVSSNDSVKFIYISTDAVYPSYLNLAKESDCILPENIYGKSKELGEFFLRLSNRKFVIIRTTIVGQNIYTNKISFVDWIINSAKSKESIGLFDDVLFTPISIWMFIDELNQIIDQDFFSNETINLSGSEPISKFQFGKLLIDKFSLDSNFVRKSLISQFSSRSGRSNNQSLDCSKYELIFSRKLPDIEQTIQNIYLNYKL